MQAPHPSPQYPRAKTCTARLSDTPFSESQRGADLSHCAARNGLEVPSMGHVTDHSPRPGHFRVGHKDAVGYAVRRPTGRRDTAAMREVTDPASPPHTITTSSRSCMRQVKHSHVAG